MTEPEKVLKSMMRGLIQNSVEEIYSNHRKLYKIGESILPIVEQQLLSYPWSDIKYRAKITILSGLLSLINDISETRAKEIGDKIITDGCDDSVKSRIKSIVDFSVSEFTRYKINNLSIICLRAFGIQKKYRRN